MTAAPIPLPPYAAHRWVHCAASASFEARYPDDQESPANREGKAADWYLSQTLADLPAPLGCIAPNGYPVDRDMVDAAQDIIRDITDTLRANNAARDQLRIQYPVCAEKTIHPNNNGRPDIFLLLPATKQLFIWDYKYGHRYVDAFRNWQCLDYAAAILESAGVFDWSQWSIFITIAQPRNYHPDGPLREWQLNGGQLSGYVAELRNAAHAATSPNPPMVTGEHCRDCNARHACPALERAAMSLVDMSLTGQPIDLPPQAAGLELTVIRAAMKRLGARATGLEEELLAHARAGRPTPFWRGEYSMGRERWLENITTGEIKALGDLYGVELLNDPKPVTPAQAKKAGVDPAAIEGYAHRPRGAMALVPFDETDIAKRFS